ncbi:MULTISPECIES: CPBP family intramembrane glutamic endopeptidase [Bacillus]|nr:type II CAAX endopeptidase family protein [Bacillus wiedmannii]OAK34175.1 CAAX protease [Bacillus wiedmannii]OAK41172.1 CAAX protease [Bacillus wiedmannii]PHB76443.1 CPBP family intramembrane metalloprotease [Bacillus wiedmannii]HDR7641674.1 CPBP family intramembrane metalloprotease [Bacillus wiedmannii]HDR7663853.1 CPBP family intramembrane metalloprotease [Bacillus wiedmannii]
METKLQQIKISWKQFILGTLLVNFIALMIVGVPLKMASSLNFIQQKFNNDSLIILQNFIFYIFYLFILILFILKYKPFQKIIISVFNIKPLCSYQTYLYILLTCIINTFTDKITNLYSNSAEIQAEHLGIENLDEQSLTINIMAILSIALIGPIQEEIIYRGIIIKFFETKYSFLVGLILSSLLFGIAHNYDIPFIIFATVMGIMYSLLYKKTNSIFPCIIAHITYNLSTFL